MPHSNNALRLRPAVPADAFRMLKWMRDPEVANHVGLRTKPSLRRTREWLARASVSDEVAAFAIEAAGKHVGNLVFDRIDRYLSTTRLSIYIGERDSRLCGIGTRAVLAGLKYAFTRLHVHKVWLTVHCANAAAVRAYLRAGFSIEGVLRDEFILGRKRLAVFYMGILKREFIRIAKVDRA